MKIKHFKAISLILIGLMMISFMSKLSISLHFRPEQGKTQTITSKANMMTMLEVQGQTMNMSQMMEIRQSFNAKNVTDMQSDIETQVEAIKMSISQMGMKLEYDSEHPEKTSPMLAGQTKEFEESLNKSVTITYDALGHLVGDTTDLAMNQLSNIIIELPEEILSIGSKWNTTKNQNVSGAEFIVKMEYTVTDLSRKSVDVSFTGNIDSKEVTGTYNGTANIDPHTGLVMSSTTKTNISMTMNEQGLSIPMTVVGTTTIEVK